MYRATGCGWRRGSWRWRWPEHALDAADHDGATSRGQPRALCRQRWPGQAGPWRWGGRDLAWRWWDRDQPWRWKGPATPDGTAAAW